MQHATKAKFYFRKQLTDVTAYSCEMFDTIQVPRYSIDTLR
jgi:hypothetical protein